VTVAVALGLTVAPAVGAAAANGLPAGRPLDRRRSCLQWLAHSNWGRTRCSRRGSGKSYFLTEASVAAAVLTGFIVLGLYGDVAMGGVIFGMQFACASAARAARKVGTLARDASPQVRHVAGSTPPAPPREEPARPFRRLVSHGDLPSGAAGLPPASAAKASSLFPTAHLPAPTGSVIELRPSSSLVFSRVSTKRRRRSRRWRGRRRPACTGPATAVSHRSSRAGRPGARRARCLGRAPRRPTPATTSAETPPRCLRRLDTGRCRGMLCRSDRPGRQLVLQRQPLPLQRASSREYRDALHASVTAATALYRRLYQQATAAASSRLGCRGPNPGSCLGVPRWRYG
jgi:hypothetical protein